MNNEQPIIVGLDIGTTKVTCIIANVGPDGVDVVGDHYDIIGAAICGAFIVFGALSVIVYGPWRRWVESKREARMVDNIEPGTRDKKIDDTKVKITKMDNDAGPVRRSSIDAF